MIEGTTGAWAERLDARAASSTSSRRRTGEPFVAGTRLRRAGGAAHAHPRHLRAADRLARADFADVMHVPSIDFLMSSAAALFGSRVLGALLTGMGSDGALGMLAIRRAGGVTLAQSEETAFMPSMPMSASELGAAGEIVPLNRMAKVIADRVAGRF